MDEIIEQQGWNDQTMLFLHEQFLEKKGLTSEFTDFLQKQADDENSECASMLEEEADPGHETGH